jgi:predicted nucleic acid-binding protein
VIYLLDTNTLTESLKGHPKIVSRLRAIPPPDDVQLPVISWFEAVRGRMATILTASEEEQLLRAQERLDADLEAMNSLQIRGVNEEAARHFSFLRSHKKAKKIQRPDLLIACIALANNATLVTRNVKNFESVPRLLIQNWFK